MHILRKVTPLTRYTSRRHSLISNSIIFIFHKAQCRLTGLKDWQVSNMNVMQSITWRHRHSSQGHAPYVVINTAPFSYIEFSHIHVSQISLRVNRIEHWHLSYMNVIFNRYGIIQVRKSCRLLTKVKKPLLTALPLSSNAGPCEDCTEKVSGVKIHHLLLLWRTIQTLARPTVSLCFAYMQ